MSEVCMPYLGAIKTLIEDAFPNSRVNVWSEKNSVFNRGIVIKAVVDGDGAYTTVLPDDMYTEADISALLIALLKERKAER